MGVTAIVQARMGSTRLPGKVLEPLAGRPMLWHVVRRAQAAPGVAQVVVATADTAEDQAIVHSCEQEGIAVFAGSEDDVLDRFHGAVERFDGDPLLRITGDCPLVDPGVVGRLLELFVADGCDYAGVSVGGGAAYAGVNGYPDGLDAECFTRAALDRAWEEATDESDREHVTPYLWRSKHLFRTGTLVPDTDYSALRLTVDEPEDLVLVSAIYDALYRDDHVFALPEVLTFLREHPKLAESNQAFVGKEKYRDLWEQRS